MTIILIFLKFKHNLKNYCKKFTSFKGIMPNNSSSLIHVCYSKVESSLLSIPSELLESSGRYFEIWENHNGKMNAEYRHVKSIHRLHNSTLTEIVLMLT